jgi:HEAT repeat protein
MADATTKKLVELLAAEHPLDLRSAAARILAEIGERGPAVDRILIEALNDPDPGYRAQVLFAIGKLKAEPALPRLLEKVEAGGPESELAAQAAARLGSKGTKALREVMGRVAPGLRQRIAAALGTGESASAETAALETLLDSDRRVVDAATRSLVARIPSFTKEHRRAVVQRVLELLDPGKADHVPPAAETALLRLLAALADPRTDPIFWSRLDPKYPAETRAAALQAIRTPPRDRPQLRRMLVCAQDADFRVAAPALISLKGVAVERGTVKEWLPLLDAPDPAARRFAIEKLAGIDTPEVAAGLLRQLNHPDGSLRQQALAALANLKSGRRALADALLEASSPDEAWSLARIQAPFAKEFSPASRTALFDRASDHLDASDRRADPLLFLLRESDARELRDRIEARALALRKQKHYQAALVYLGLLTRDPACGEAIRFESAACALKLSSHDLAAESRALDPALQGLGRMLHHGSDVSTMLTRAKWLDADDLFYVGFHFSEGSRQEKEFGVRMLQEVVRRSPRSQRAKDARNKLRSQGLD